MDKINGVNLPAFVSNMIMTTKDTTIEGPVKFTQPVVIEDRIAVQGDLKTKYLNGIQVEDWLEKAIFINRGLLKGVKPHILKP